MRNNKVYGTPWFRGAIKIYKVVVLETNFEKTVLKMLYCKPFCSKIRINSNNNR